jgi:hypothetical protein
VTVQSYLQESQAAALSEVHKLSIEKDTCLAEVERVQEREARNASHLETLASATTSVRLTLAEMAALINTLCTSSHSTSRSAVDGHVDMDAAPEFGAVGHVDNLLSSCAALKQSISKLCSWLVHVQDSASSLQSTMQTVQRRHDSTCKVR